MTVKRNKKKTPPKTLKLNTYSRHPLSFCHSDGSWAARRVLSHKRVFKTNEPIGIVVRLHEGHLSCWRLDTARGNTRWGAGPINLPWLAGNCIFVMSIRCESTWIKAEWGPDWWRRSPNDAAFPRHYYLKVTESYRGDWGPPCCMEEG